jgi:CRISPR-associated endonuclease/helicase Cas3
LIEYYKNVLQELGYKNERRFLSEVVDRMADQWNKKNLFVIEAPTGYGKTTITATLALKTVEEAEKLIVAYPLRTLLEDQFSKVAKIAPQDLVGKRYMHEASSPYLIRPVTLTTIDTLSLTMFGIAPEDLNRVIKGWEEDGTISTTMGHYLFSWSSVMLSNIVLDEAHLVAEESKSLTYLIALIEHIISHDQKVILMSATMPTRFKELILDSLRRYKDKIEWMDFSDPDGRDDFVRSRLEKRLEMIKPMRLDPQNKFEKIRKLLDEAFERGYNRALMIFNTVREAVTFYKSLDGYENKLLIHSRFTDSDRMKKHDEIRRLKKSGKYVIVATQVVEAGMDISSDLLITDLSPMCALIQRFGRFLRYED